MLGAPEGSPPRLPGLQQEAPATFSDADRSSSRERPRLWNSFPHSVRSLRSTEVSGAWQPLSLRLKATAMKKGSWNSEPISELQSKALPAYRARPLLTVGRLSRGEKPELSSFRSASLVAQRVKRLAYNAGDLGLIPGWGRYSGEGNGNPRQYSCLENPMDGEAW